MIICGDIGGTKTLLGLAQDGELLVHRRYANADFPDFAAVLAAFLADTQTYPAQIGGGCLALAGPIADDGRSAHLTNLPWAIDSVALSSRFGLPRLQLSREPRQRPTMLLNPAVKDIFGFRYEDFTLQGYEPHPHIPAPVAV